MTSVVDSKHQQLSTDEIISIAAMETGSTYSFEQGKAALAAEVHEAGAVMLRQGNTLFILHKDQRDPTVAVFRALNADTAQNYIKNSAMFLKAAASMGFRILVTQFKDEGLLSIFKAINRNRPLPQLGYVVQKTADGGYRVTVSLGQGNQGGLPNSDLAPQEGNI